MFHMLCCFDLKSGVVLEDFQHAFEQFTSHLQAHDLVVSSSPVGIRQSNTILDTDTERSHQYFSIMSFADREQSDAAVQYIADSGMSPDSTHHIAYSMVEDPVFICWQDAG